LAQVQFFSTDSHRLAAHGPVSMNTSLSNACSNGDSIHRHCLADIFKLFDHRGDGLYSRAELTWLLEALDTGSLMTDSSIGTMMQALDAEDKGWIHYEAFCAWVFPSKTAEMTRSLPPSTLENTGSLSNYYRGDSSMSMESLPLPMGDSTPSATPIAYADLRSVLEDAAGVPSNAYEASGEVTRKAGASDKEAALAALAEAAEQGAYVGETGITLGLDAVNADDKAVEAIWSVTRPPWGSHDPAIHGERLVMLVSCAEDANSDHRAYMEDGHKVVDPLTTADGNQWGFYAVFDGHGGRDVVDYCESTLHEVMLQELGNVSAQPQKDVKSCLESAFKKIDHQLSMLGTWKSGATATVALVQRSNESATFYMAHVGDSRAVAFGSSGPSRLTRDHKASDEDEQTRIKNEGGMIRHGRVGGVLCVSRSLGDHHLKDCGVSCIPEVSTYEIGKKKQAMVIASDGLWDVLDDADASKVVATCVKQAVAEHDNEQGVASYLSKHVAAALVQDAKAKGSGDNIIALVIFF